MITLRWSVRRRWSRYEAIAHDDDERQWVKEQIQASYRQAVADVRAEMCADLRLLADHWLTEIRELRREVCWFTGQPVPPPPGEDGYGGRGPLQ